ncbi:MAG: guanylate kinase [Acidobacteria bacterium]|nr:guanylate kinase [Acidobacteriota bacterium]
MNAEVVESPVEQHRGILFVVSSPSGGGKGTLIRRILTYMPRLGYSISWTTRAPRQGEMNGRDYHFVTPEEFAAAREREEFLEWAVVHGHFYGTSLKVVERELAAGRDIILEIDVQGAVSVRRAGIEAVSVFILPPSFEILKRRLTGRQSENADALALRLQSNKEDDNESVVQKQQPELDSKYRMIIVAAQRSKQLQRGARPRVQMETQLHKHTRVALLEIEQGKVGFTITNEE